MSSRSLLAEVLKDEHRAIRDLVVNLVQAFRNRDLPSAHFFVNNLAELAGPHFRYEEEALYPALLNTLTEEQVLGLLSEHDHAIAAIRQLAKLLDKNELTNQEAEDGATCAQSLLTDLTQCDGLSLMIERLPDQSIRETLNAWRHARAAHLDLLQWADTVRPPRQWQVGVPVAR